MSSPNRGRDSTQGAVFRRVCQQGNVELARQILATGVNVDAAQEDGCTALWLAAEEGQVASVVMLCEHEANLEAVKQPANVTPLYIACQNGHLAVADVLLMHSANPNTTKANGSTPLHIAAQQGFVDICRLLLRYGGKHSPRNIQGVIPLHLAAYQGHDKVVLLLLAAGADHNSESQGKYTLDWAESNGHGRAIQRAIEEATGHKMAQEESHSVIVSLGQADVGRGHTIEGSPAAGTRGTADHQPSRSAIKQPFMVQVREGAPDRGPLGSSSVVNNGRPLSDWYIPSYLNQTAARSPSRNYEAANTSLGSSGIPPAKGLSGPTTGKGGFTATSLPLTAAIQRENERNAAFRNRSTNNPDAGSHGIDDSSSAFAVKAGSGVKAVEDNWEHFKRRLDNQRRFLNSTRDSIPDGWMYTSSAVDGYRKEIIEARAVLEKAAMEGRAAAPKKNEGKVSNCIGLDEEQLGKLRAFLLEGEGAKPPVTPNLPVDQEDLALQQEPPSPTQFRSSLDSR